MIKLFQIWILLFVTNQIFSQEIYYDSLWNFTNKENAEYYRFIDTISNNTFVVKDFYMNGTIQMEGNYSSIRKDTRIGIFTWYSKNGTKTKEGNYTNGKKVGVYKEWYESGQKKLIGRYSSDKRDSLWTWWYENGIKYQIYQFTNGKFGGYAAIWDTTGIMLGEVSLDKKLKNGSINLKYSNGNPKVIGQIKNGKPNGEIMAYYRNGNLRSKGYVKSGFKTGNWIYYNSDGSMEKTIIYNNNNKERVDSFTKEMKKLFKGS